MLSGKLFFKKFIIGVGIVFFLGIPIAFRVWQIENHEFLVKKILSNFITTKSEVTIRGVIDAEPDVKQITQDFIVHTDVVSSISGQYPVDTRILVSEKLYPTHIYGEKVEITGRLIVPRNFSDNSSDSEGNSVAISSSRQFDYIHYLSKDGIYFTMKNPVVRIIGYGAGNPLFTKLFLFKDLFLNNIRRVLGEPQASLAAGEIVGDKASLGKELTDDFRRSGLIHIVILSGYSIAIIADSIQRLLSVVPYLPRWGSLGCGALGIMLFGIMIGGKATAVRACIMAIMSITAKIMYRDYNALRALIFTAYVMVLFNPYIVIYDASFQVSFTATLGLILFGKHIEKFLKKFPRLIPERFEIRALITSTLATQIAVAPLLLYMMGDASIVGLIANLIVVPFIPLTLLVIFCTGMFGFLTFAPGFLSVLGMYASIAAGALSQILLSYELLIVQFFGSFSYATIIVNNFSLWMMWGTYAVYGVIFIFLKRWKRQRDSSQFSPS